MRADPGRTPRRLAALVAAGRRSLASLALGGLLALALGGSSTLALGGCERGANPLDELASPRFPERIDPPHAVLRPGSRAKSDAAVRPNLLLVSIDTLRADRLGAYGHDRPTSPHLDRLAAEGTLFENAYSHSPKTAPSHMTLFTGLYPEAHRVRNRTAGRRKWRGRLSDDVPTLAEMLRAAGYRTLARTSGGNLHGDIGFARGFDSFEEPAWGDAERIFAAAIEALPGLSAAPEPFFLLVHTYQVHSPYLPPEPYRERFVDPAYTGDVIGDALRLQEATGASYDALHDSFWRRVDRNSPADRQHLLDLYDACIRFTDDQLGALLERLDSLGLAERTVVVVLSDHGEQFGEHGGFEHDALWQELLRVPLVVRVPAAVRPGWQVRRIAEPVGLVHVLPTLLELLGLRVPSHVQGRSLVPLVEGDAPGPGWVFAQNREAGDVALLAGDWKLVRRSGGEQLFDLAADPGERRDAGTEGGAVRDTIARQIDRLLLASRAYWRLAREAAAVELDAATRSQLEALGYTADAPDAQDARDAPDAQDARDAPDAQDARDAPDAQDARDAAP